MVNTFGGDLDINIDLPKITVRIWNYKPARRLNHWFHPTITTNLTKTPTIIHWYTFKSNRLLYSFGRMLITTEFDKPSHENKV